MLSNILNHDGVTALNKKQQESITGGMVCRVIIQGWTRAEVHNVSSGQEACDLAGEYHSSIHGSYSSCRYDCDTDGFESSWW